MLPEPVFFPVCNETIHKCSDSGKQVLQLLYNSLDNKKQIDFKNLIPGIVQEEGYCFC